MGPQFVLANIPTIQIGHVPNEDILVKNKLCLVVNRPSEFLSAIEPLQNMQTEESSRAIERGLGIRLNWSETLQNLAFLEK